LCSNFAAKCGEIDEIDERPLSVDLHDRQPFAICGLELGVSGDVHLLERLSAAEEHGARLLAEMAALRRIENDVGGGYG
jgi:hypothetical protein